MTGIRSTRIEFAGSTPDEDHPLWVDLREAVRRRDLTRRDLDMEWVPAGRRLLGVVRRSGSQRCLLGVEVGDSSWQPARVAPFLALPLVAAGRRHRLSSWLGLSAPVGTVVPLASLQGPEFEVALRQAVVDLAGFHGPAGAGPSRAGPAHGDFTLGNLVAVGQPDRLAVLGWRRRGAPGPSAMAQVTQPGSLDPQLQDLLTLVDGVLARRSVDAALANLIAELLDAYAGERALPLTSLRKAVRAANKDLADRLEPHWSASARSGGLDYRWPHYGEPERRAMEAAVGAGDVSWPTGATRRLEEALCDAVGVQHAVAHANGTSAMFSAMVAVGVGAGDEVVCPSYTWWASVSPALWCGARVVFCEVGEDLGIDVDDLARRLTSRTRAVVVPHLWGSLTDVDLIRSVCGPGVAVIEDASHAFGTHRGGVLAGTAGDVGVLSLQAQKPLAAGEGGALLTSDQAMFERGLATGHYERLRAVASEEVRSLAATGLGLKFRMSPLHASLALAQLEQVHHRLARQQALVQAIAGELQHEPGARLIGTAADVQHGGRAGLRLLLGEHLEVASDRVVRQLTEAGVAAGRDYLRPLHLARLFADTPRPITGTAAPVGPGTLPRTEALCRRLVALPLPTGGSVAAAQVLGRTIAKALDRAADS